MKKLVFLFFIICNCTYAQDTIRFRSGEMQAVKVNEVGVTDINYNRFDNLQGPKYVVNKNDILLIKYAGGHVDSFSVEKPETKIVEKQIVKSKSNYLLECDKIRIEGKRLFCFNRPIGESRLLKIISAHPDNVKRNDMMKVYYDMKKCKRKQYIFGFAGLGVGIAAPYIGFVATLISQDPTPLVVGIIIGGTIGITGGIVSSMNKIKRTNKKMELARLYNE